MNLEALRKKLKAKMEEAKAILAKADAENEGVMSEDQQKEYDAALVESETIEADIERLVKLENLEKRVTGPMALPASLEQPGADLPGVTTIQVNQNENGSEGFRSLGDFAISVYRAQQSQGRNMDPRLTDMIEKYHADAGNINVQGQPTNVHVESGEDEGFLVPPDFSKRLWELMMEQDSILNSVNPETTSSNTVTIVRDQSTPWDATGIQTKWEGEAKQLTTSKLLTEGDQVRLHKHFAFVTASDELLEDAPLLTDRLMRKAPEAILWNVDDAIVNGDGAGKPKGWAKSAARVVVAKESGQTDFTINADNVSKMFARMWAAGHADSFWMIGPDVLPELFTMTLGDRSIWTPPDRSFQDAPGGFLFGRPIRIKQHAQALGTEGDIHYVSPRGYYATTKTGGIQMAESIHLFFDFGVKAFRWTFRIGGQTYASRPIPQANSANDLSHFVLLADRK